MATLKKAPKGEGLDPLMSGKTMYGKEAAQVPTVTDESEAPASEDSTSDSESDSSKSKTSSKSKK